MTRVLICGDRHWTNRKLIRKVVRAFKKKYKDVLVIEGGAPGADTIAKEEAMAEGIPVCEFPANWKHQHRAAGPIRNAAMLKWGSPDFGLAFHDNIRKSRGTRDMVKRLKKSNTPVAVIKEDH